MTEAESTKSSRPIRILIVDDNAFILAIAEDLLSERGHQVRTLDNATSVIETVKRIKPQLLILDIMMPEVDGIEICRQIKTSDETKNVIILIHSGKKDMELMDLCYEAGAAAYHIKSGDIEALGAVVDKLIEGNF